MTKVAISKERDNLSSIDLCAIFLTLLSLKKNDNVHGYLKCLFELKHMLMLYVPVNTCLVIVGHFSVLTKYLTLRMKYET